MKIHIPSMQLIGILVTLSAIVGVNLAIETKVQSTEINGIPTSFNLTNSPFRNIGEKYYYIESSTKRNWYDALHVCRAIGSYLVNIETSSEMDLLLTHLNVKESYWLSGNDLPLEKTYVSASTGKPMSYTRWIPGQPSNSSKKNCVLIGYSKKTMAMADEKCSTKKLFICETNKPKTLSLTVW